MKKPLIFSFIFAGVVFVAVAFAVSQKSEAPEPGVVDTSQTVPSGSRSGNGTYVEYSETTLAEAAGERILFFHAPWCPQCRSIEEGIVEQGVPEGYTIIKVDYDTNQELRKKYDVTIQTTFVKVNDELEATDKYVAYDEPTFEAVKREFL